MPVFGGAGLDSPELIERGGKSVEGTVVFSLFNMGDARPEVLAFGERYKAKFGVLPDSTAAQGYDTLKLLVHAINSGPQRGARESGRSLARDQGLARRDGQPYLQRKRRLGLQALGQGHRQQRPICLLRQHATSLSAAGSVALLIRSKETFSGGSVLLCREEEIDRFTLFTVWLMRKNRIPRLKALLAVDANFWGGWRGWRGSNPRPLASEANTLSTELQPRGGIAEEMRKDTVFPPRRPWKLSRFPRISFHYTCFASIISRLASFFALQV